jgi:hypothetical protein
MRRILPWAAAAAILAIPASGWCQGADPKPSQENQSQTPAQSSTAATTATNSASTTSTTMTASPAPQQESLAEAARKAREAKKDATKPPTVFTNDNIPTQGGISTVGDPSSDKHDDAEKGDKGDSKSGDANGEKAWRDKFAALRAKLARDTEDLNVMQRELGVLDLQNYSDPVKAMQQSLTRDDINKKTADIDAKALAVKADQQAIDDAQDELRKSGGDSGWAR